MKRPPFAPHQKKPVVIRIQNTDKGETYSGFQVTEKDPIDAQHKWKTGSMYILHDKKRKTGSEGVPYYKLSFKKLDYPKDEIVIEE